MAARFLISAAYNTSKGFGLYGAQGGNDSISLLSEAYSLIENASSKMKDSEREATFAIEFCCCRALMSRIDYSNPDVKRYTDRAVELAPRLQSLSPHTCAAVGNAISMQGQFLWTLAGAGKHLDHTSVAKAARYHSSIMYSQPK